MVSVEDDIIAAGAQLIWVLERTATNAPGTATNCYDFMTAVGSEKGICVGDSQTLPTAFTFDNSPFSVGRGFDLIVPRSTMVVEYTSSHGSTAGNDNVDGPGMLQEVQNVLAGL